MKEPMRCKAHRFFCIISLLNVIREEKIYESNYAYRNGKGRNH